MTSGCESYSIYKNDYTYTTNTPTIHFHSYDPHGYITTAIKKKLRLNNISYIDYKQKYINIKKNENYKHQESSFVSLYIIDASEKCIKTSLFQDGQTAEYQLILTVVIKIETEKKKDNVFNVSTSKTFYNNPLAILANSVKEKSIREIIYQETVEKITNKILFFIKNN